MSSSLIAIAFDDAAKAQQMVGELKKLQDEGLLKLEDSVIVTRDQDGKATYTTDHAVAGAGTGALMGSLWGLLIGSIFLMPVLGVALGAATGAATGALDKVAVDDAFKRSINDQLRPNSSAVIIRVANVNNPEKIAERLKGFGGTVLHTNLSTETETQLQAVLAGK
jgi:uncharacterized membrane protein